jgi:hypothetical protein
VGVVSGSGSGEVVGGVAVRAEEEGGVMKEHCRVRRRARQDRQIPSGIIWQRPGILLKVTYYSIK